MTGFHGPDPGSFDEFLARFLGSGAGGPRGPGRPDPARMLEERLQRREPTGRAPSLTPAAKRALLDGHQVSRSLGSTYIGPEHILLAIAANDESAAGRLLDDGRLTDGQGRTVDRLRDVFRPEFLNRIDEIIVFRRLDTDQLATITQLLLEETRRRLAERDVTVEFRPEAVQRLAEMGHQPEFGARPLRRTSQREVDNRLSAMLLAGEISPGRHVRVGARDGELTVEAA
jgi:ATP-dependent Clp protease ATP-binding subunit ClpA